MISKKERACRIAKILDSLYPEPAIPLSHKDPYTLLIAVLLSAQCTDKRVNQVTPKLFACADTPEKMVQLPWQEIQQIIRSCGLSQRKAQAIWNLSQILVDTYNGTVPSDLETLKTLPGVGHKTASVVVVQAFGTPSFPVDTHIHRCAKRWGLSSGKNVRQTERDLKRLFPQKTWGKVHLQIIHCARQYCPARSHKIISCPICSILV